MKSCLNETGLFSRILPVEPYISAREPLISSGKRYTVLSWNRVSNKALLQSFFSQKKSLVFPPKSLWFHRVIFLLFSHEIVACCSALQCVAVCCSVLQCVAVCCSVLQCVAVCCSVLQCAAMHVSISHVFVSEWSRALFKKQHLCCDWKSPAGATI